MAYSDDEIAALIALNAKFFAAAQTVVDGQVMMLAGSIDDPDSFDKDGGKTGALGYYPVVNVNGQTIYFPCLARFMATAAGATDPAVIEALLSTSVDAARSAANDATGAVAATEAARNEAVAAAVLNMEALAVVESLDPEVLGRANIVDPSGRIVGIFPDPAAQAAVAAAYRTGIVESLDPAVLSSVPMLDAAGRLVASLASGAALEGLRVSLAGATERLPSFVGVTNLESLDPEVLNGLIVLDSAGRVLAKAGSGSAVGGDASGEVVALKGRVDRSLSARGDIIDPVYGRWFLREIRMRLRKRKLGEPAQLVIALLGDSLTDGGYWIPAFAKALQDRYGVAGIGWVGFGWWDTVRVPPWTEGAQPLGKSGNARSDFVTDLTMIGAWTCRYNQGADSTLSMHRITSSTAGDRVRFAFPAGHNASRLYYFGVAGAECRYSWNGGASWTNLALATVGAANVALAGTPAVAASLIIEVVAGTVSLSGVDMQSSADGVRVHKLGGSGAQSLPWASVNPATWQAQLAALGPTAVVVGLQGNDKSADTPPDTFAGRLTTIMANVEAAVPYADRLLTSRPENARTDNIYSMAEYTARQRALAVDRQWAHLDHQFFWGRGPEDYGPAHPVRPWLSADLVHPVTLTGGRALADASLSLFDPGL